MIKALLVAKMLSRLTVTKRALEMVPLQMNVIESWLVEGVKLEGLQVTLEASRKRGVALMMTEIWAISRRDSRSSLPQTMAPVKG